MTLMGCAATPASIEGTGRAHLHDVGVGGRVPGDARAGAHGGAHRTPALSAATPPLAPRTAGPSRADPSRPEWTR